ncbi:peroxiredoxin family protein [Ferdinandcohnia sp. Marseille-Q9671]
MHFIQIGSLAIMTKWIILGLAVIGGLLSVRLWLTKTQAKEITKNIFDLLVNSVFLGFLTWKGSVLLLEPKLVLESPMSLLYFTGGEKGLFIAIVMIFLYLLYHGRKGQVLQNVLIRSVMIVGFTAFMIYDLLALFLLKEQLILHFIKMLCAFFLLLLTLYVNGKQKKEVFPVLKKAAIIVGLTGLVVWTVNSAIASEVEEPISEEVGLKVGIAEGQLAPDFSLKTLDGEEITLSSLRGKRVILNFWASWCPPCKAEMPHMQEFYEENINKDVELLSVNLTTAEKKSSDVARFVDEYKLTFPILLDQQGEIGQTYQAFTIPTSYLIDSKGIVRKKIVGPMDKELMYELIDSVK